MAPSVSGRDSGAGISESRLNVVVMRTKQIERVIAYRLINAPYGTVPFFVVDAGKQHSGGANGSSRPLLPALYNVKIPQGIGKKK